MATSFGTAIPTIVFYRVSREGACIRVRMYIGETAYSCRAEILLLPSEFRLWRATINADPAKCSIWYADGVFEWLNATTAEVGDAR